MGKELAGKTCVVTGAAAGIGRATAELFAEHGANVVIADIDGDLAGKVALAIGANAAAFTVDIAEPQAVQAMIDFAIERFGGLQVLCNNAAKTTWTNHFLEDDLSIWGKFLAVNIMGTAYACQAAARHMRSLGGGSIINVTSIAAVMPGLGFVPYRATKAAVDNMTKSLAIELAAYDIRVNALAPGNVKTQIMDYREPDMTDEDVVRVRAATDEVMMACQPLKRRTEPRDLAEAALFLASDRSRQVTGATLLVDGGITAGDAVDRPRLIQQSREQALAQIRAERAQGAKTKA